MITVLITVCKRVFLIMFLLLCTVFVVHNDYAMAKTEDGLYIGGSRPLYFSIDDMFDKKQKSKMLTAFQKTAYSEIYFVIRGKMANVSEVLKIGDFTKASYPFNPRKLEKVYTRSSDGSKLVNGSSGGTDDSDVPKIEFIR